MKKSKNKIKNFLRKLATPLILLIRHILSNVRVPKAQDSLMYVVRNRAVQTSADYIEENISKAMLFDSKERLWDFALSKFQIKPFMALIVFRVLGRIGLELRWARVHLTLMVFLPRSILTLP